MLDPVYAIPSHYRSGVAGTNNADDADYLGTVVGGVDD